MSNAFQLVAIYGVINPLVMAKPGKEKLEMNKWKEKKFRRCKTLSQDFLMLTEIAVAVLLECLVKLK